MKPQTNIARGLRASVPLFACLLLAMPAKATVPSSDLPDLGSLNTFAEVGNQLDVNQSTVNGDLGVFSGGKLTLTKSSKTKINGDIFAATNVTFIRMSAFNGIVFSNQDLSSEQSDVFSDSSTLAGLAPDVTLSKAQTKALSFDVSTGQVEVVDLNGGLSLNNKNITLTGGGDLVLNIKGSFSLNGTAGILGNPDDIFINFEGTRTIASRAHDTIDGLVFDPNAAASLGGTVDGGVFGGGKQITLSGATLTQAPEPGPTLLISTGLTSLLLARRRFRGPKNEFKKKKF